MSSIRTCRLLCASLATLVLATGSIVLPPLSSAQDGESFVIVASPTDGHLRINGDDGWDALRESNDADIFDDLRYVKINTRPDIIYRGFLFFDTSALPSNEVPTAVRLNMYAKCTGDLDDCQLYILECPQGYPHEPLEKDDSIVPWDSMIERAHIDVGDWTKLAYREVSLDPSTISIGGTTVLCLVERRDYEDDTPPYLKSENEIKLFSYEEGKGYYPYLDVTWGAVVTDEAETETRNGPLLLTGGALAVLVAAAAVSRRSRSSG